MRLLSSVRVFPSTDLNPVFATRNPRLLLRNRPPSKQVAAEGETYYRYGVMLKKVANFYNNMASQVWLLTGLQEDTDQYFIV